MSWLSKVTGFFLGGAANSIVDSASDVADIVERFNPGPEKRQEMETAISKVINDSTASARAMKLAGHNTWFDVIIDGINRMIRPYVTVWITGGMSGWWSLPDVSTVSEFWQQVFWTIMLFWFGGRAVLKDIPKAIGVIKALGR